MKWNLLLIILIKLITEVLTKFESTPTIKISRFKLSIQVTFTPTLLICLSSFS